MKVSRGEVETPGVKQVTVRLPEADWKRIAHLAIDENTSIHALIIRGLNVLLKERKMPLIKVE